jgi:hypothetical protein
LAYVEPKELGNTLIGLTSAASNFARAQVAAMNTIAGIVKTQAEEFTQSLVKKQKVSVK